MRPHALHPGAIQGKEGIKFCHLATLAQALPVAFLAMHEEKRADAENEDILEIWGEVWSDGTPGTEGGIRLYLKVGRKGFILAT